MDLALKWRIPLGFVIMLKFYARLVIIYIAIFCIFAVC